MGNPLTISADFRFRAAFVFVLLISIYAYATGHLFGAFPYSYTWSELLVNYEGGIVKRGLFGEIAYLLDPYVSAKYFGTILTFASYVFFIWVLVCELRLTRTLAGLLFLFSPGGMLFPIYDLEAFGRKDAFLLVALGSAIMLINRVKNPILCFVSILAIYTLVGLMIEVAWFYFPLVVALYLFRAEKLSIRGAVVLTASSAIYAAGWLLLNTLISQGVDVYAAAASWIAIYPDATPISKGGALCCVNVKLSDAWGMAMMSGGDKTLRTGYLIGALLSLVPLVLLIKDRRKHDFSVDWLVAATGIAGILTALSLLLLAADWGRYIYLALVHVFVVIWAMKPNSQPSARTPGLLGLAVVVLYATTWQMKHFQLPGGASILPGVVW